MKTIKNTLFLMLISVLVGCTTIPQRENNEIRSTASVTSTQAPLPTPSVEINVGNYFPNLTPIPTPSVLQQADIMFLLTSEVCKLPCYLNIEPEKTTFDEAGNTILNLGGTLRADYENFYKDPPETLPLRLSSYIFDVDSLFYIDLAISGKNNQVQQIVVNVFGNSQPLFYETWAKYSIESIFKIYGKPDQVRIDKNISEGASYFIRVVYFQYGMILDWFGSRNGNSIDKICPEFSKKNIFGLQIILDEPQSTFENIPSSYMGFEEMYKSTEEILGISEKEFFDQVVANDSVCFDIKIK